MTHHTWSSTLPNFTGYTISEGAFHLRFVKKLAKGAYGAVYLAEDVSLRASNQEARQYAVKCILRDPSNSVIESLLEREITNHSLVSDIPNVVTLHRVIEEDCYTFFVLDLCTGGDLFTAIMERDTFVYNTEAVKRTFLQIVDAVEECHSRGVYHRDLKPENILCSEDGTEIRIVDFGLSTRDERSPWFRCGTSYYMSPECLRVFVKAKTYSPATSDIWALGVILCNITTGRSPWHVAYPKDDDGFRRYLAEGPEWFLRNLPVSLDTAVVLGRIFDLNPATRVTFTELRELIDAVETFYPYPEGVMPPPACTVAETHVGTAVEVSPLAVRGGASETEKTRVGEEGDEEIDITDAFSRLASHEERWGLLAEHDAALSAASSITFADVVSAFINEHHGSQDIGAAWSDDSDSDSDTDTDESSAPHTPQSLAAAADLPTAVSDLALDSSAPESAMSEYELIMAARFAQLKKGRRGSVDRLIETLQRLEA